LLVAAIPVKRLQEAHFAPQSFGYFTGRMMSWPDMALVSNFIPITALPSMAATFSHGRVVFQYGIDSLQGALCLLEALVGRHGLFKRKGLPFARKAFSQREAGVP
jgi:hypothetical protein